MSIIGLLLGSLSRRLGLGSGLGLGLGLGLILLFPLRWIELVSSNRGQHYLWLKLGLRVGLMIDVGCR
jgi:hypothetical protein